MQRMRNNAIQFLVSLARHEDDWFANAAPDRSVPQTLVRRQALIWFLAGSRFSAYFSLNSCVLLVGMSSYFNIGCGISNCRTQTTNERIVWNPGVWQQYISYFINKVLH